jgi:hypothetical protein
VRAGLERATVEYNLALGQRRAFAVRKYLETLGVGGKRLQLVSYGKELPLCTEHDEACWQENRRAGVRPGATPLTCWPGSSPTSAWRSRRRAGIVLAWLRQLLPAAVLLVLPATVPPDSFDEEDAIVVDAEDVDFPWPSRTPSPGAGRGSSLGDGWRRGRPGAGSTFRSCAVTSGPGAAVVRGVHVGEHPRPTA